MDEYKPGQGGLARLSTWLILVSALFLGVVELYSWLHRRGDGAIFGLDRWRVFRSLPFFGVPLSWKVLLCVVLLVGLLWLVRRYMTKPRTVDMLIETELEMKKVSWPTLDESLNATWVVVLVTVLLTGALFFFDFALGWLFRMIF